MIAGLCNKRVIAPLIYKATTDTTLFNNWLENCLAPHLKTGQLVVMDNYIIHKSDKTRQIIENTGAKLLFLPPYSPDLNPIENTWALIKQIIRFNQHRYDSIFCAIKLAFLLI